MPCSPPTKAESTRTPHRKRPPYLSDDSSPTNEPAGSPPKRSRNESHPVETPLLETPRNEQLRVQTPLTGTPRTGATLADALPISDDEGGPRPLTQSLVELAPGFTLAYEELRLCVKMFEIGMSAQSDKDSKAVKIGLKAAKSDLFAIKVTLGKQGMWQRTAKLGNQLHEKSTEVLNSVRKSAMDIDPGKTCDQDLSRVVAIFKGKLEMALSLGEKKLPAGTPIKMEADKEEGTA